MHFKNEIWTQEKDAKIVKMPFSSKTAILGHFWPFKNSKQGVCVYSHPAGDV